MRQWASSWAGILVLVGVLAIILGLMQHFIGLVVLPHLAIYLGALGLVLLIPGVVMTVRRSG
jgi:hypothetical protein